MAYLSALLETYILKLYGKKGVNKVITPKDHMPMWGLTKEETVVKQTPEQIKEFWLSFAKSHNKRVKKFKNRRELQKLNNKKEAL